MIRKIAAAFALASLVIYPSMAASALPSAGGSLPLAAVDETGIGIRLLDIPADAQDDPRARSYIVDHVAPGENIARRIQVQNNTSEPKTVRVYVGAAEIVGDTFLGGDGAAVNELTTWISTDVDTLEMAPGEQADVSVTITVPADAAEGEQYAALWAEVRSKVDAQTNIVSASRVGVRVYLSVGQGNGPTANFEIGQVIGDRTADGSPHVTATITNTGGRALDINATLALTDGPGGLSAGPFESHEILTIAPGELAELSFVLDKALPAGPWQGTIEARSGLVVHSMDGQVSFGAQAIERQPEWMLIAVVWLAALVVAGSVAAWIVTRRRRRDISEGRA